MNATNVDSNKEFPVGAKEGELRNDVGGGGAEQFYSVSFASQTLFPIHNRDSLPAG